MTMKTPLCSTRFGVRTVEITPIYFLPVIHTMVQLWRDRQF